LTVLIAHSDLDRRSTATRVRICHEEVSKRPHNNNVRSRLERATHHPESSGELERLKVKWWPHECSATAAAFISALLRWMCC